MDDDEITKSVSQKQDQSVESNKGERENSSADSVSFVAIKPVLDNQTKTSF